MHEIMCCISFAGVYYPTFKMLLLISLLELRHQGPTLKKRHPKSLIKVKERNVLYIISFLTFWFFCVKTKERITCLAQLTINSSYYSFSLQKHINLLLH
jgi:hypothetical protein